MNAVIRLLVAGCAVALFVASCGQKGPLTLPEDHGRLPHAVTFGEGGQVCAGDFPRV